MKSRIFILFVALILAACSPTFPLVYDSRPTAPTPTYTPWVLGPPGDTATPEVVDTATPEATPVCDILGNINQAGQRIYYTPESINHKNVKINLPGEQVFCSTEAAEAAGFRRALK